MFVSNVLFGSTWHALFNGGLYIGNITQRSEISQEILDCLTTVLSQNVGNHLLTYAVRVTFQKKECHKLGIVSANYRISSDIVLIWTYIVLGLP